MRFFAAIIGLAVAATLTAALEPSLRAEGTWTWHLPSQVQLPRLPSNNAMSEEKFQLGRHLFYDKRLSGNGTLSCSSCHLQEHAFTDAKPTSPGSTGEHTPRNAPSIANAAWHATYTWANPSLVTLERQAEVPLFGESPIEMGVTDSNKKEVLARFAEDAKYLSLFKAAFPDKTDPISFETVITALAAFQRGVTSFGSRYDLYLEGKAQLSESEERGLGLFFGERAECHHCHGSANLDDQFTPANARETSPPFHNTGLYNLDGDGAYPYPNRGVLEISGKPEDMGRFRAPSLRNVAVTAPYMHDGSVATLEEVIAIYSDGGRRIESGPHAGDGGASPKKSDLIVRLDLTDEEKADLLAFLRALTDEELLTSPRFSNPWK
jgi:cytochrome c peroxidase